MDLALSITEMTPPYSVGEMSACVSGSPSQAHMEVDDDEQREVEVNGDKRAKGDSDTESEDEVVDESKNAKTQLQIFLKDVIDCPHSAPFLEPVDAIKLKVPDYYTKIKEPMDLQTMGKKLDNGEYEDPWKFISDFRLMINNAWHFNYKKSYVYDCANKLNKLFESKIDTVMKSIGHCCGSDLYYRSRKLYCYGKKDCEISKGAVYFMYQHKYTFCRQCFDRNTKENMVFETGETGIGTLTVAKKLFEKFTNHDSERESFVHCKYCQKKVHEVCVIHFHSLSPNGYICSSCLKHLGEQKHINDFTAIQLPMNSLQKFLNTKLNSYISHAKLEGKDGGRVFVRVLSTTKKILEVKPLMKKCYSKNGGFPDKFPYKSKAIFAFQEFDGVEVCFFGMHCQEYGSDCPQPNTRRVYITYLDSVNFFKPKEHRTAIYRTIILGYLEHVVALGYKYAHIWACPPAQGDDYIFYSHPQSQKFPKYQRLQDWYKKLLDQGILDNIIVSYQNLKWYSEQIMYDEPYDLPYLEGDYWVAAIEESLAEVAKTHPMDEEVSDEAEDDYSCDDSLSSPSKRKRVQRACKVNGDKASNINGHPQKKCEKSGSTKAAQSKAQAANSSKKRKKSVITKSSKKSKKSSTSKSALKSNTAKRSGTNFRSALRLSLISKMNENQDTFFVIKLADFVDGEDETFDPDPVLPSALFDGREEFLFRCRTLFLEFSDLRRAKFSTSWFLCDLHQELAKSAIKYFDLILHVVSDCKVDGGCVAYVGCKEQKLMLSKDSEESNSFLDSYEAKHHMKGYTAKRCPLNKRTCTYKQYIARMAIYLLHYHALFCDSKGCTSRECERTRKSKTKEQLRKIVCYEAKSAQI